MSTTTQTLAVHALTPWLQVNGFTPVEAVEFYDALETADGTSAGERPKFSQVHDGVRYTAQFVWNAIGDVDVKVTRQTGWPRVALRLTH